jgi:hypothetical protein
LPLNFYIGHFGSEDEHNFDIGEKKFFFSLVNVKMVRTVNMLLYNLSRSVLLFISECPSPICPYLNPTAGRLRGRLGGKSMVCR